MSEDQREPILGWEAALSFCPPEDSPLLARTASDDTDGEQRAVTRRYDRMAWLYDFYDAPMEYAGIRRRRKRLVARARGRVLEVGVGTGKNLPHYPAGVELTAIDVSEAMVGQARRRAERLGIYPTFELADVTTLPFPDDTFDTTLATAVFCSVADPVAGLRELSRVTKPDGQILLLEHVRPRNPILGWLADLVTVFTRRIFGFTANRRTEENVVAAGLEVADVRREGIWREIIARPGVRDRNEPGIRPA
ncbi:MAG: class I SAM-dependent methyltransferase [Acidimicrobiia bacterium]